MARRVSVAFLLVISLLLATAPATARHTAPPENHDALRATDTEMRLWLFCDAGGAANRCDENRNMTGRRPTSDDSPLGDGHEDLIAGAQEDQGSVEYTFWERSLRDESDPPEWSFSRDYGLVDATTRLRFQWEGEWNITVTLTDSSGTPLLGSEKTVLSATDSLEEANREFDFDQFTLPEGENLHVKIEAEVGESSTGAEVSLIVEDVNDDPSRVTLTGDLVGTQLWTHTPSDIPRSIFRLDAPESDRRIQSTYVLTSAFGADGLSLSDGTVRGRNETGDLIDLTPNSTGHLIDITRRVGEGAEHVWEMTESWNYSEEREPGRYTLEARLTSNTGDLIVDETTLTLGAGIDISIRGLSTREVRPGENATYRIVVDNQAGRDVEVDLRLTGVGTWDARLSSPTIVVPDEGQRLVDLKVTPDASAQDGDEQQITIEADPQDEPGIDPVSTTVTTRAVDETRFEPFLEVTDDPDGEIAPDGKRNFTVTATNNGTVRDDLFLTRADVPDGWTVEFTEDSFSLDPGERRQVEVTVRAPSDAELDSEHDIVVEVQSAGDADANVQATATLVVGVFIDYDVDVLDRIRTVPQTAAGPGSGVMWRFEITSHSNVEIEAVATLSRGSTLRGENDLTIDPGQTAESYAFDEFPSCDNPTTLTVAPRRGDAPVKTTDLVACPQEGYVERELLVEPRNDFDPITGVFTTEPRDVVEPGESTILPVRVSNVGTENYDSVALDVVGAPPGWSFDFLAWDDPAIESYSDGTESASDCGWFCESTPMNVTVPENASAGKHEIVVAATSKTPEAATGTFTYVIEVPSERNVSVRAVEDSLDVQPGGDAIFNLVVDNQGNVRETIDTTVDTGQLPGEWTMRPVASQIEVPPNGERYVTTILSPPDSASAGETGSIDVTAATDFGTSDDLQLTATVVESSDITMSAPFTGGSVEPGTAIPYDVQITNQGSALQTVSLGSSAVPPGFDVTLQEDGENVSSVTLGAGNSTNVTARIHVPEDVAGLVGTVLRASPDGGSGTTTLALNATIRAVQDVQLQVEPKHRVAPAGQSAEYVVTVFNRGTAEDTVFVCIPDLAGACHQTLSEGPWTESVSQSRISVQAKESRSVLFTVVSDPGTSPGATRRTPVTARSVEDPSASSTRTVETEVLKRDVAFATTDEAVGAAPGQTVTAAPIVENKGNDGDVFAIEIVGAPDGWSVDPTAEVRVAAGASSPVPIQVTPPPEAERGSYGLQVRAFSKIDPSVEAETTTLIRVADFRSRDVDDDGHPEYAVDANGETADGFESFAEISDAGIHTVVIESGTFGETVRTGFILRTQEDPVAAYRFWAPDADVLTNVTAARILRQDSLGYLVDVDDDGGVEFMYDEATDETVRAVSVQGRDAYLVDADDDGTMDTYYNHDRGITTTAADHPGEDVAVDEDGDGSYDLIVNGATGTSHDYTALDAVTRGFLLYGWLFLLGIAAIVLADVVFLVRVKGGSA